MPIAMSRYYCDYCDTYLTHDSPSVRKQHNAGYKHKANVRTYYQQFEEQLSQVLIDQRIKEHLGQTAAIQQVGAAFNQHFASFPPRPGHSILSTPVMPVMGASQGPPFLPLAQGIRPPIMPRPVAGAPGYVAAPVVAPPGAPSMSMQVNGLQGPPTMIPSTTQGGSTVPSSNGAQTLNAPALYQANSATPTNASPGLQMPAPPTRIGSQDGFSYSQASDTNHYLFILLCWNFLCFKLGAYMLVQFACGSNLNAAWFK